MICPLRRFFVLAAPLAWGSANAHAAPQFLDDEAEPSTDIAFDVTPQASGSLRVVFDYRDARNFYALDLAPGQAALRSVINGVPHRLHSAKVAMAVGKKTRVVVQRRPWLMRAIIDDTARLTAYDATFNTGKIGLEGAWKTSEPRVQPVERVLWKDDFTRLPGQSGDWTPEGGDWALTSSSDSVSTRNADMSANPFSFLGKPKPKKLALARAGRWFWDAYDAEVSARPMSRGTIGLAVYVRDAQNFLAFEWDAGSGATPNARRVVRVRDGVRTTLKSAPGGYLPRQWYRLRARVSPGWIEVGADGETFLRVRDDSFGQGGIGLLSRGTETFWDDAKARSNSLYRQEFDGPTGGAWTPVGGAWRAGAGTLTSSGSGARSLLAGRDDWTNYEFGARAAASNGACGVLMGYRDAKNYAVFRWAPSSAGVPFRGRQQLVAVKDGRETVLSDEALSLKPDADGFYVVTAALQNGGLSVWDGAGKPLAQGATDLASGRCGLWASGATARFRGVSVAFPPEPEPKKVAPKMQDDALMVGWASASGEWRPQSVQRTILRSIGEDRRRRVLEFWNAGEFFGGGNLSLTWKRGIYEGVLEVALNARRGDFDSGVVARIETEGDDKLKLSVARGDKTLKSAVVAWKELGLTDPDAYVPLQIALDGRALSVAFNKRPALSCALPNEVADGSSLGARAQGFALSPSEMRADSTRRDDDTFTQAPVAWYATSGDWKVIARWPCYSDWSFFGGKGLSPTLWSKRVYARDIVADIYAHPQMDVPKEIGYTRPGDLNITLCGDGKNPFSGYSFIVAGWDNTRTRLYRRDKMVGETRVPEAVFHRTMNHDMNFHRRRFNLRAEVRATTRNGKRGALVRLTKDDVTLLEHFDPQPLSAFSKGGRVSFWSADGTLMLARARIDAQELRGQSLPSGLLDPEAQTAPADAPKPVVVDGVPSALVSAGEAKSWSVRNPQSGGAFAVSLPVKGKIGPDSVLRFDFKAGRDAHIDLYPTINGRTYRVQVTGTARPDAQAPDLGRARMLVAGEGWTRVEFNLGAVLNRLHGPKDKLTLEGAQLGALTGEAYRWTGLNGNPYGASYSLRNVQLAG